MAEPIDRMAPFNKGKDHVEKPSQQIFTSLSEPGLRQATIKDVRKRPVARVGIARKFDPEASAHCRSGAIGIDEPLRCEKLDLIATTENNLEFSWLVFHSSRNHALFDDYAPCCKGFRKDFLDSALRYRKLE